MKKLLFFIILPAFILTKTALAEDDLRIEIKDEYTVLQNLETQVQKKIKIVNLTNEKIAGGYTLSFKNTKVYDVEIDNPKNYKFVVENNDDTTKIEITFLKKSIGKGGEQEFSLSYKTKDLAVRTGQVTNINIPKISGLETIRKYEATLSVPSGLGPEIFVSPKPYKTNRQEEVTKYLFEKDSLLNSGISGAFGKFQLIGFNLLYQLENKLPISAYTEVALPPDVQNYQQIAFSSIDPKPNSIYEDEDGNLLARYYLKYNQKLEIRVRGMAKMYSQVIEINDSGKISEIPRPLIEKYTKTENYWNKESYEIMALKNKLYEPDLKVSEITKKIYDYIVENMTYDYAALDITDRPRLGAESAIRNNGKGTCTEFTDLFIATARAFGIPAREANGYAINTNEDKNKPISIKINNEDVLHAWPQYYDPKYGWIYVDPTWGNTSGLDYFHKLDTNHLTFVIKGKDPLYPVPAGMYRVEEDANLVDVEFLDKYDPDLFKPYVVFEKFLGMTKATNESGLYIYNIQGQKLLPYQSSIVKIGKNATGIQVELFGNTKADIPLTFRAWNFNITWTLAYKIIFSIFLASLLYSFLYFVTKKVGCRKRPPFRQPLPPRDQDQLYNQRS